MSRPSLQMLDPLSSTERVILFLLLAVSFWYIRHRSTPFPVPPGPDNHWFKRVQIPSKDPFLAFEKWTREYGPVFSLRRGNSLLVVIGRHQAAVDIMEKEGASLADRPRLIAAGEILSGGMRVLITSSGPRLRRMRKALHAQLQPKIAAMYEPVQYRNARNVILDILSSPDQHQTHAKRYAASVIMTITYGKTTPTSYSDPEVQEVNACLARLGAAIRPGAYAVDAYPILRYVPGYLNDVRRGHELELSLFRRQFHNVKTRMANGIEIPPCFAKQLIENQAEYELSDDEMAYLAGSMFGAGSDTTAGGISFTIMAAACHPASQKLVQDELDRVIGHGRPPHFDDLVDLPSVKAFAMEVARWRPVSVTGFPHRATKDIIWNGMVIPKGSTVIGSHWSICRDPDVFPDPESFEPRRWLQESGSTTINPDLKSYPFGFGRRVCPGSSVAERSLYINTALLLWAFDISTVSDAPVDTMALTQMANIHPLPFKVKFEPRVAGLRELVL